MTKVNLQPCSWTFRRSKFFMRRRYRRAMFTVPELAAEALGDFLGNYMRRRFRKANALYLEFEEIGLNRQLGYNTPADVVNLYPKFYWDCVAPHVQTAIRY